MTPTTPEPAPSPDLDLREANVLAVTFEAPGEGRYRFDVNLLHDDDGEAPDFADWWQVKDEAGNTLGRRILGPAHAGPWLRGNGCPERRNGHVFGLSQAGA